MALRWTKKAGTDDKAEIKFARHVVVTPVAAGWQVWREQLPGHQWEVAEEAELEALVGRIRADDEVQLLLPTRAAIVHTLLLPAAEIEDAASMAELQAEKFLPFPRGAQPLAINVLKVEKESEHALVTVTLATPKALDELAAPLVAAKRWPVQAALRLETLARQAPPDRTCLILDLEGGDVVIGLIYHAALAAAEVLAGAEEGAATISSIERWLWEARLNGLPATLDSILLGEGLAEWLEPLATHFGAPAEVVRLRLSWPVPAGDLSPSTWATSRREVAQRKVRDRWLLVGAMVYVLSILGLAAYLWQLNGQLSQLSLEVAAATDKAVEVETLRQEWNAWAPAVDADRFAIELLRQVVTAIPNPEDLKLTMLRLEGKQVSVVGEAPDFGMANQAISGIESRLQEAGYTVNHPTPTPLANNRARFQITGARN